MHVPHAFERRPWLCGIQGKQITRFKKKLVIVHMPTLKAL